MAVRWRFHGTVLERTTDDIYVKVVGPGDPVRLTRDPAAELSPAWSPDGGRIAFLRYSSDRRRFPPFQGRTNRHFGPGRRRGAQNRGRRPRWTCFGSSRLVFRWRMDCLWRQVVGTRPRRYLAVVGGDRGTSTPHNGTWRYRGRGSDILARRTLARVYPRPKHVNERGICSWAHGQDGARWGAKADHDCKSADLRRSLGARRPLACVFRR